MHNFTESFQDMRLEIFEACLRNEITVEEREALLDRLNDQYLLYIEGVKDVAKDIKTVVKNPKSKESKEVLLKAADKYNEGMNKRATAVAKRIVKDPTKGGTVQVSSDVYEKYKKDMLKWRTRYKVGEILATGAIAIGPIDTVIKIATATAVARSSDPVDKATMELMNKMKEKALSIKNKLKGLVDRVRGKKISEQELSSEISSLDTATAAVAKQTDSVKSKKDKTPVGAATEAVYNKIDNFLALSGEENKYKALNMIIESVDFNEIDMMSVICHYTNI